VFNETPNELKDLLDGRLSGTEYLQAEYYLLSVSPACEREGAKPVADRHGQQSDCASSTRRSAVFADIRCADRRTLRIGLPDRDEHAG
jgi:hypothetical protein